PGEQKSVRTPLLTVGQQASFEVDVVGPALVSFFIKTDSDPEDTVSFLLDGEVQSLPTQTFTEEPEPAVFSGTEDWRKVAFLVQGGEHNLRWTYNKGSEDPNSVAFVDGLAVLKPIPKENLPNRTTPPGTFNADAMPPLNVDLAIEDVVAEAGTYILDDSQGTGRLPISVVVGSTGSDFDVASINANFVSNLEIRLSLDSIYGNSDDVILGSYLQTQVIEQGDKIVMSGEINLPFDTPAGNYNIIVRFIPPPQVQEFSLVNNTVVVGPGFVIVRAPDLVARNISTPSSTYPFHPEDTVNLEYTITNRGLGTVTPDQPFDVSVTLMAYFRSFDQLTTPEVIKQYDSFDIRAFLPEISAAFPHGGDTRISQQITLPTLRDMLVALDVIDPGTPEDDFEVSLYKNILKDYTFYFSITLDSNNDIIESSETNTFFSTGTNPLNGEDNVIVFNIFPTPGLENYGSYTGQLPFSVFIDEDVPGSDLSLANSNSDGDNFNNLLEYAMGTNPTRFTNIFQSGALGPDALGSYSVASLTVPPFTDPQDYLTMTFDFNVRANNDIVISVEGSDDMVTWEDVLVLNPPYIDDTGSKSLTGFGGLKDNPVVLAVDGNVSAANSDGSGGIQKVYTARITVRDLVPFADVNSRFLRVSVAANPAVVTPPQPPTNLVASYDGFVFGVRLAWSPGNATDARQGGAFQILRSVAGLNDYEAIGSATTAAFVDTDVERLTTYDYRVRLVNALSASDSSNVASVSVP
ncbi:MAG: hypothetical protein ACQKBV_09555, partial [Puniceicoccales bacterium]